MPLEVVAVDMKPFHLALLDVNRTYVVPPVSDPTYIDRINEIVQEERIDFLHPQPDVEVAFLSKHRAKIQAQTFLPPFEVVELCQDKMRFNQRMRQQGVPVPEAFYLDSPDALKTALEALVSSEARQAWLRAIKGAGSKASLPVFSFKQADAWIDYWRDFRGLDYGDFMVSEFLPGKEFAWQSLWHKGELITAQSRERMEYVFGNLTASGQSSSPSLAKTVNRSDVDEVGMASVRAVSTCPHGVFCVDMKENAAGEPKVMEINAGRFFTTSNFFAHAGLNMPELYVELALTETIRGPRPAQLHPLEEGLYWVRSIDMGYKLLRESPCKSMAPAA